MTPPSTIDHFTDLANSNIFLLTRVFKSGIDYIEIGLIISRKNRKNILEEYCHILGNLEPT